MQKEFTIKNMSISLIVLLLIFQFFRIDKTNKVSAAERDVLFISQANPELASMLKNSCYDCHSNQVTYPWYTNIAPLSWWIKHHVNEGTRHLNFSEWGTYSARKADHKLKECFEMIKECESTLATDLWALGCMIFKMYTGRVPFPGMSEMACFPVILKRQIDWPKELVMDDNFVDLIDQLL